MKSILKSPILAVFLLMINSGCNRQSFEPSMEDLLDVIRVNFYEEYGGLVFEQKYFASLMNEYHAVIEVDTIFNEIKNISGQAFDIEYNLEIEVRNSQPGLPAKNVNIEINRLSAGRQFNDILSAEIFALKSTKKLFYPSGSSDPCVRNSLNRVLNDVKFTRSNKFFDGEIKINSWACLYDITENDYLVFPEYDFSLEIYSGTGSHSLRGRIVLRGEDWMLISDEGEFRL